MYLCKAAVEWYKNRDSSRDVRNDADIFNLHTRLTTIIDDRNILYSHIERIDRDQSIIEMDGCLYRRAANHQEALKFQQLFSSELELIAQSNTKHIYLPPSHSNPYRMVSSSSILQIGRSSSIHPRWSLVDSDDKIISRTRVVLVLTNRHCVMIYIIEIQIHRRLSIYWNTKITTNQDEWIFTRFIYVSNT